MDRYSGVKVKVSFGMGETLVMKQLSGGQKVRDTLVMRASSLACAGRYPGAQCNQCAIGHMNHDKSTEYTRVVLSLLPGCRLQYLRFD